MQRNRLYYSWQRNTIAQDDQITERFTRAVDQLGNRKIEVRLGGIYALERISTKSDKDYWQIMEILTAYVRNNSRIRASNNRKKQQISIDIQANEIKEELTELEDVTLDIQAILNVLRRRNYSFDNGETNKIDLQGTNLQRADLYGINLYEADLYGANLHRANLYSSTLSWANLSKADLYGAMIAEADLEGVNLSWANLSEASFNWSDLGKANFKGANLTKADFEEANLLEAENLTFDQLSKAKTLYGAQIEEGLLISLKEKCHDLFVEKSLEEKYPHWFEEPKKK